MIDVSQRLTERLNRARLKLEVRRSVGPLVVYGVGVLVGLVCAGYILSHIGGGHGETRKLRLAIRDATGLVADRAEVRFKNIPAGNVREIAFKGDRAVVTVEVAKEFGPIYRDARAAIRPNTPLQDMYVDIVDRGTPAAGPVGEALLPVSQTATTVNVSDVLNIFAPGERAHMAQLLDQLGRGLDDRGVQLRQTFAELGPFIAVVGRLSRQLEARRSRTQRLVTNVGELTKVLGDRDKTLRRLVDDGSTVLAATAGREKDLDAMLAQLPPTLSELDRSLATVRGVLPDVDGAVDALGPAAEKLPEGLRAVQALSGAAQPAVSALGRPLRDLVPLARNLAPLSRSLSSTVASLRPQMPDVATVTKTTAGCPLAAFMFFHHTASLTKFQDEFGVYPRGDFGFGMDSLQGLKDPGIQASPSCAPNGPKGATP